ncbi:putative protein kinase RLK-Pelle-CrRLK1L-1 family [Helianthus debilis subsp. tardiflorus]
MEQNGKDDQLSSSTSSYPCRLFSLAEIQSATMDFDDELVIGKGAFGKVYKGQFSSEKACHVVAIKRLDSMSNQGEPEFKAEIEMLSKLRHCHLVSLVGYCEDSKEMILVYEYMPNGTLYHRLHKAETPLNWVQRMKIAIGAGRGLDYLHTGVGTQHGIIHRDVKTSNILLDENWEAMISDFGLSKIGPTNQSTSYVIASVKGTFGYLDPVYFYTKKLTRKIDVYAFGVVLFELLSGRLAVDESYGEEHCSLVSWAKKCVRERKIDQMVDPCIRGTIHPKCAREFAQIADHCVHSIPEERPTMTEVVASLQALLVLQRKYDESARSTGRIGFTSKIQKFLVSITKQNTDQTGRNSPYIRGNNMSHCSSTNKDGSGQGEIPHLQGELVARDVKKFTYGELKLATRNFGNDTYLGEGNYGKVYKGWVDKTSCSPCQDNTGFPIAVKRLHRYKLFDLEMLKEFRHPNLVKLVGYCLEAEQLFLVYEFINNKNLSDLLRIGAISQLPLATKVKIAVGIARGIAFLQTEYDEREVPYRRGTVGEAQLHRHNILLDEDFTAKHSDFDVALLVHGHYPYKIMEDNNRLFDQFAFNLKPISLRMDHFGFAVVLAEVLTGKQIFYEYVVEMIDDLFLLQGRTSLYSVAQSCFRICNEVDSESKMFAILEEYDKYIFQNWESKRHF